MAQPEVSRTTLEWALSYWQLGWNALAAPAGEKAPVGSWKRWQTNRMVERDIRRQFENRTGLSIWVATGIVSGLAVLDCDSEEAEARWADKIDLNTARVKTSKGRHFFFRLEEETPSWKEDGVDFQAEGKGVIVPPSQHKSGFRYTWEELPTATSLLPLPELLRRTGARGPVRARSVSVGTGEATEKPRDMLAHVLSGPAPAEGERNTWLISQLGKAALRAKGDRLVYDALAVQLAEKSGLEEAEAWKTVESAWSMETSKTIDGELPTERTGWLCAGPTGETTMSLTQTKGGVGVGQWADAGFRCTGVADHDDGRAIYDLELITADGKRPARLDSRDLADGRRLGAWLLGNHIRVFPAPGAPKHPAGSLLSKYLDSQEAPRYRPIDYVGWDKEAGAFITHDNAITAKGEVDVPVRSIARRDWANRRYGMASKDATQAVWREALTFHHPAAVGIIASFVALSYVKGMLDLPFWPILGLESPKETGKTQGFVPIMVGLSGNQAGATLATEASYRYMLSSTDGLVWIDDQDDPDRLGEMIRMQAMNTSYVKMAEDRSTGVVLEARASSIISGESLGAVVEQGALYQRFLLLTMESPKGRKNTAGQPQWGDVLAFLEQHDLSDYAGRSMQLALEAAEALGGARAIALTGDRNKDKHALLGFGAKLLEALTGEDSSGWQKIVREYTRGQSERDEGGDALTRKHIPQLLRLAVIASPTDEAGIDYRRKTGRWFPVLVDDAQNPRRVCVHPGFLSDHLEKENRAKRGSDRTDTAGALQRQLKAIGSSGSEGGTRQVKLTGHGGGKPRYWWLTQEWSRRVLEESLEGEQEELG